MDGSQQFIGKLEVDVPDDSFEAGKICTARIIIRNPFDVSVDIIEIDSPRSSTLDDLISTQKESSKDQDSSSEHKKRQSYEVTASIGRGGLWSWILNMFGLSAEIKFGEVRSSREKIINIRAEKDSEIILDQEVSQYETINIVSDEGAKIHLRAPDIAASTIDTIATISPHCEIVQYFPFKTTGWVLFKPIRLNASVQIRYRVGNVILTQVVPALFDIRPPIASIVFGALIGAVLGSIARIFVHNPDLNWKSVIVSIGSSTVMSLIATIALMRKSGAQGFITVEDFFGSFVLGSLIGYSGPEYFEKVILPKSPDSTH